jgi:hypothetical protein
MQIKFCKPNQNGMNFSYPYASPLRPFVSPMQKVSSSKSLSSVAAHPTSLNPASLVLIFLYGVKPIHFSSSMVKLVVLFGLLVDVKSLGLCLLKVNASSDNKFVWTQEAFLGGGN